MGKNKLEELMEKVVEALLEKVKSGEATAADMANAIRLMKDSGIRMDPSTAAAKELIKDVPFSEDEFKEMLEG